jgi:hypothetical protein
VLVVFRDYGFVFRISFGLVIKDCGLVFKVRDYGFRVWLL